MVIMGSAGRHASYWRETSVIIRNVSSGLRGAKTKSKKSIKTQNLVCKMLKKPRA